MALSFNGTTLATNLDAVMFNGTAVSKVMFNGTEVWAKLVNLTWSGNSLTAPTAPYGVVGLEASGNLFRAMFAGEAGAWITTQTNGTFVGNSTTTGLIVNTSGNLVKVTMADGAIYNGDWVTYTLANKSFTGLSKSGWDFGINSDYYYLETSGGLMRFLEDFDGAIFSGAYISLT